MPRTDKLDLSLFRDILSGGQEAPRAMMANIEKYAFLLYEKVIA